MPIPDVQYNIITGCEQGLLSAFKGARCAALLD
jgi:hypothetical protein